MPSNFTHFLDFAGTFAFAVSGIRMASKKQMDWFGAYIIGLVTAIGGGTVRDLLLDVSPFWMTDPKYFITTGIALLAILVFKDKLLKLGSTLFLFDTIGLGLFTVVGLAKSMDAGLPFWVCIILGSITGSVGGVTRDIILNQVPLIFRKDIYALACVVGGAVFFALHHFEVPKELTEFISAGSVILIRLLAVKFEIHLPQLRPMKEEE